MSKSENQTLVSVAKLARLLGELPIEASLSSDREQARQQLGLALYRLDQFIKGATNHRNQLLGRALDPAHATLEASIIDQNQFGTAEEVIEPVSFSAMPIVGWDAASAEIDLTILKDGQAIFDPEFSERTAYLLSELAQDDVEAGTTQALLGVDRLDLLLTLARTEATRLVSLLSDTL